MKEFNWTDYQEKILKKLIEKYGSKTTAILEMDAQIASLKVEADALREMVDWDKVKQEGEEE